MLFFSRFLFHLQLVFPKRAAMLLDRLMVALHHALEDEDPKEIKKINELYRNGQLPLPPITPINPNFTPKYYKGKSENDAYYGYKLVNGQAGELKQNLIRCFIGVKNIFQNSKRMKQTFSHTFMSQCSVLLHETKPRSFHCSEC